LNMCINMNMYMCENSTIYVSTDSDMEWTWTGDTPS
jgi:hypothetical protein